MPTNYHLENDELTNLAIKTSKLTHLLEIKLPYGVEIRFKSQPLRWYIHHYYEPVFEVFIGKRWQEACKYINDLPIGDSTTALKSLILDCGKDAARLLAEMEPMGYANRPI